MNNLIPFGSILIEKLVNKNFMLGCVVFFFKFFFLTFELILEKLQKFYTEFP